jgi:hypothetical protein
MKSPKLAIFLSTLFAAGAMAQSPAPSENTNSQASIAGGIAINAELDTSIDSKKAKSGEAVVAHTTEAMKATDNREIMQRDKIDGACDAGRVAFERRDRNESGHSV